MRNLIALIVAAGVGLVGGKAFGACVNDPRIDWRTHGGFTLFNKTETGRRASDALLDALAERRGAMGEHAAAETYGLIINRLLTPNAGEQLYQASYYDRVREVYGASNEEALAFLKPAHRQILASAPGLSGDCVWRVDDVARATATCGQQTSLEVAADQEVEVEAETVAGRITTCVRVQDTLILALGDSFAAGEGNPDRPTDWTGMRKLTPGVAAPRGGIDWWSKMALPIENSADWWDNTCHRSLLSQHALAALQIAATDRRRTVTFISFACSGATVLDGYVAPRTSAPGGRRFRTGEWNSIAYRKSQINQAVELLCADPDASHVVLPLSQEPIYWNKLSAKTKRAPGQSRREVNVRTCRTWLRRPDIVLNTMGGNDIGFAGVGAWAVMPPAGRGPLSPFFLINAALEPNRNPGMGLVCPLKIEGQWRCETLAGKLIPLLSLQAPSAEDLALRDLPAMLELGARAFDTSGLGDHARAKIHTLYPSILRDEVGRLCGATWTTQYVPNIKLDEGLKEQREPWLAQFTRVPLLKPDRWSFGMANLPDGEDCLVGVPSGVDLRESCVMEKRAWANLNHEVNKAMAKQNWTLIDQSDVTARHGLCARDSDAKTYAREFGWPRWTASGWDTAYGVPTAWTPYAWRTGRWFRTANDAALTQYVAFKGAKGRNESVSGTIHPTAQAHFVMAGRIIRAVEASQDDRSPRPAVAAEP